MFGYSAIIAVTMSRISRGRLATITRIVFIKLGQARKKYSSGLNGREGSIRFQSEGAKRTNAGTYSPGPSLAQPPSNCIQANRTNRVK
jgi:hypothetical protein